MPSAAVEAGRAAAGPPCAAVVAPVIDSPSAWQPHWDSASASQRSLAEHGPYPDRRRASPQPDDKNLLRSINRCRQATQIGFDSMYEKDPCYLKCHDQKPILLDRFMTFFS